MARSRLVALDGLRGIAAIAVVIFHCDKALRMHGAVALKGYIAVDFFFCLSGFVLAYAHLADIRSGRLTPVGFIVKRYLRFAPTVAIGSLLAIAAALVLGDFSHRHSWAMAALSFFVLPLPTPVGLDFLNGVFWSLLAEIVANLAFAVLASRASARTFAIVTVAAFLGLAISIVHFGSIGLLMDEWRQIPSCLLWALSSFFIGVVVFGLWDRGVRIGGRIPFAALVAILLFPMIVPIGAPIVRVPLEIAYAGLVLPLLVLAGASSTIRRAPILTALGEGSFMLYAIHKLIVGVIFAYAHPVTVPARLGAIAIVVPACTLLAWAMARHVEMPLLRRIRRRSRPTQTASS